MLLAIGGKLDGEDEQGKKGKKDLFPNRSFFPFLPCSSKDETRVKKPSTYKYIPKYI